MSTHFRIVYQQLAHSTVAKTNIHNINSVSYIGAPLKAHRPDNVVTSTLTLREKLWMEVQGDSDSHMLQFLHLGFEL